MAEKITVSDSELEILEVLWSAGTALNANEIRTALNEHKSWERTTILTLIQRLLKKGALMQEKRGVYYYTPCIAREAYVKAETKSFLNKYFQGSFRNLTAALVDSNELTPEDIEALRAYFNRKGKEERK